MRFSRRAGFSLANAKQPHVWKNVRRDSLASRFIGLERLSDACSPIQQSSPQMFDS
jgi:hypothetical protein